MSTNQKIAIVLLGLSFVFVLGVYLILNTTKKQPAVSTTTIVTPYPTDKISSLAPPNDIRFATPNPRVTLISQIEGESGPVEDPEQTGGDIEGVTTQSLAAEARGNLMQKTPILEDHFTIDWDKYDAAFVVTLKTETAKYDFEAWLEANYPDLGLDDFSIR